MPFSLGSVYFNLGADTRGLDRARQDLQAIERQVNHFATMQGEGAARAEAAWRRQEAAATSALQKVLNLTNRMRSAGVDSGLVDRATASLNTYINELSMGRLQAAAFQRSNETFAASLGMTQRMFLQTSTALKTLDQQISAHGRQVANALNMVERDIGRAVGGMQKPIGSLIEAFRNLASASVLFTGPLGGIATRVSALSAIFSRSGAAGVAFAGGLGLGAYAASKFSGQIFDVARTFQNYNAQLLAANLSQEKANEGLRFAIDVAQRAGVAVQSVIPTWAQLTAAVRGTALEGKQARDIFDTFAQVGSRLRLTQENMQGIFKALEQMISKGTVFREELVQQLGDRFPGALRFAAQAMGVTTAEFNKMTAAGQVLSVDFLPKFAATIRQAFGVDVGGSIDNLEASINRVKNTWMLFLVEVDKSLGVTSAVKKTLDTVSSTLQGMTSDFSSVTLQVKAFALAAAVFTAPLLVRGIYGIVTAIGRLTVAMTGLNIVTAGGIWGKLAGLLLAAGAAVYTYYQALQQLEGVQQEVVLKEGEWINSLGQVVSAANTTTAVLNNMRGAMDNLSAAERLAALTDTDATNIYIANTQKMVEAATARVSALTQELRLKQISLASTPEKFEDPFGFDVKNPQYEANQKAAAELEEKLKGAQEWSVKLNTSLIQLNKGDFQRPTARDPLSWLDDAETKGAEKKIQDLVNETLGLERVFKSMPTAKQVFKDLPEGLDTVLKAEDLEKAREITRGLAQNELKDLSEKLQLAGYGGKTLDAQLQNLITSHRQLDTAVKGYTSTQEKADKVVAKQETAMRKYLAELDQAQRRFAAMQKGEGPLEDFDKLAANEDRARRFAESLRSAGFSAEYAEQKYKEMFDVLQNTTAFERAHEAVRALQDVIANGLGSATDGLVDAFMRGEDAMQSLKDAGKQLVADLIKEFIRLAIVNTILNSIFHMGMPTLGGGMGGGGGGIFSGILKGIGSIFGGSRAEGGSDLATAGFNPTIQPASSLAHRGKPQPAQFNMTAHIHGAKTNQELVDLINFAVGSGLKEAQKSVPGQFGDFQTRMS